MTIGLRYKVYCVRIPDIVRKPVRPQILKIGVLSLIQASATHLSQKLTAPPYCFHFAKILYLDNGNGKVER